MFGHTRKRAPFFHSSIVIHSIIDGNETKGIDENGQEIEELIQQLTATGRAVTTFNYQLDPLFKVRYIHNTAAQTNLLIS
ncbi:hypothetical protein ABEY43_25460 [Priestia megaterium]